LGEANKHTTVLKKGSLSDFLQAMRTKIDSIASGKGFYFQGGWPGHAITLAVSRQGETYSFSFAASSWPN
jgi:hypothetical protein